MPRGGYHPTITLGAIGDEADRAQGITYAVANDKAATEDIIVSSVRMVTNGEHAYLTIFNRGGNAGTLTVSHHDRHTVIARLLRIQTNDLPRPGIVSEARIVK
jgi:hypothetical protein